MRRVQCCNGRELLRNRTLTWQGKTRFRGRTLESPEIESADISAVARNPVEGPTSRECNVSKSHGLNLP